MCKQTFPIFRSAAVLASDDHPTAEEAVAIGRALAASSGEFVDRMIGFVEARGGRFSNIRLAHDARRDRPRVRVEPAIIVDFPVLLLTWRGQTIESRVGITSWFGGRKSKLWIRLNFIDAVEENALVRDFFSEARAESAILQQFCLDYFVSVIRAQYRVDFVKVYGIYIQMVSSPNDTILREIERQSEYQSEDSDENTTEIQTVLEQVFRDEFSILIPKLQGSERFAEKYVYPLIDPRFMAERRGRSSPSVRESAFWELNAMDELKSLAIIDVSNDSVNVWGIVHEQEPLHAHGVSGPMIVSGELTLELGGLY